MSSARAFGLAAFGVCEVYTYEGENECALSGAVYSEVRCVMTKGDVLSDGEGNEELRWEILFLACRLFDGWAEQRDG